MHVISRFLFIPTQESLVCETLMTTMSVPRGSTKVHSACTQSLGSEYQTEMCRSVPDPLIVICVSKRIRVSILPDVEQFRYLCSII